jgi:hypothetical protein
LYSRHPLATTLEGNDYTQVAFLPMQMDDLLSRWDFSFLYSLPVYKRGTCSRGAGEGQVRSSLEKGNLDGANMH